MKYESCHNHKHLLSHLDIRFFPQKKTYNTDIQFKKIGSFRKNGSNTRILRIFLQQQPCTVFNSDDRERERESVCVRACMDISAKLWRTYVQSCVHTYIRTWLYVRRHIRTYIYTYTYIHTCMHTYIHT